MTDYICPYCNRPTLELNINGDEFAEPVHPIFFLTKWITELRSNISHAFRFERDIEGKGKWSQGGKEYRYGIIADRICIDCPGHYPDLRVDMAMPHSLCETRSST